MPKASFTGRVVAGLVSFGIKAFSVAKGADDSRVHLLHEKCNERVKQQWFCPQCEEGVTREQTVKGYEYEREKYVALTAEDLQFIEPDTEEARVFQLTQTIRMAEIDPLWIDNAYYIMPSEMVDRKPYATFSRALRSTELAGVVTFISHHKHHLAVFLPHEGSLLMQTLYYYEALRPLEAVSNLDSVKSLRVKEVEMAATLLSSMLAPFRHDQFRDEYRDALARLVQAKIDGDPGVQQARPRPASPPDLMAALQASVAAATRGRGDVPHPGRGVRQQIQAKKPKSTRKK